ncbi:MAG TPA: right-handed parallel beta-helix repeat-containing protein, partial [Nitrococcus sp.]|nr:right-handed parallel beta-helix repeat-containing protein [Nitrococcus sp.]
VWALDPATWVVTGFANANGAAPAWRGASGKPKNHGTYSRWQYVPDYDVFIGYNSAQNNVWLYRLPRVPHHSVGTAVALAAAPVRARRHAPDAVSKPAPRSEAPSLPQPGQVVVSPGATESSFPRPGALLIDPGSGAGAAIASAAAPAGGARKSESARKQENCGADLCVGPDYILKRPSQAARMAQEGDTVYIEAGNYKDCATWPVSVSIRGIHGRPAIGGVVCANKAVWITKGAKTTIENVKLEGALGGTSNAAAIRHEGKALILRNVEIYNNHNGILVDHTPNASLEVYNSVFHRMWTVGDLAHNIYAGKIKRLIVEGNYFYDGQSGHFIKSLAEHTTIAYNRIIQTKDLDAALIDIWGCSKFEVVGNAMERPGTYGAMAFIQITYRANGHGGFVACPETRALGGMVAYNTAFFNNAQHDDPRWSNLLHYNYPTPNVLVADNLIVHASKIVSDSKGFAAHGGILKGNYFIKAWDASLFANPVHGDLRLTRALPAPAVPIDFVPEREPALPVGTRPRANGRNVGAFAYEVGGG